MEDSKTPWTLRSVGVESLGINSTRKLPNHPHARSCTVSAYQPVTTRAAEPQHLCLGSDGHGVDWQGSTYQFTHQTRTKWTLASENSLPSMCVGFRSERLHSLNANLALPEAKGNSNAMQHRYSMPPCLKAVSECCHDEESCVQNPNSQLKPRENRCKAGTGER